MVLRLLFATLLFVALHSSANAEIFTLKFATLVPTGTSWTKILDEWVNEVETKSGGRLQFKMYSGGVMGDEPDVLRKIRKGQLNGGMFTGYGIGRIYSPARVLEMPFFFQDTDESDYVRERIMPDIETGFRENGFELLGWPEIGFIHLFSKLPLISLDEIKKQRIWLWQGDPLGEAFFAASDIAPVPLSIIDVYTQLAARHGSIDTVYSSTFGVLALQWYSKLSYASKIPFTNAIGGLIVSRDFFDRLPEDLKQLLKTSGKKMSEEIRTRAREENVNSISILKDNGIEFMWGWDDVNMDELINIRDKAAKHLENTGYIPAKDFDRARKLLNEYRLSHAKASGDKAP
jgi:TRAP-type transport system periplasmic protein